MSPDRRKRTEDEEGKTGEEKRRKELSKENFQQKCYYEFWYFYVQEENAEYMRWLESEQKLNPEASSVISIEQSNDALNFLMESKKESWVLLYSGVLFYATSSKKHFENYIFENLGEVVSR